MPADDLASPLEASAPLDVGIARAIAECQHCLGAYLCAVDSRRQAACPGCGTIWRVDPPPRERPIDVPADLDAVARWYPAICGRAWAPSQMGRGPGRHGERPDHVDAHHRDARTGLRRALAALSHLDALERAGQARHVRVLWFGYVLCGPELVKIHAGGREDLVAQRFAPTDVQEDWRELKSANVRRLQIRTYGTRLLGGARAAYESAARGTLRAAAPSPGALSAELDRLLARSLPKVANDCPKVANDSGEVANTGASRQR